MADFFRNVAAKFVNFSVEGVSDVIICLIGIVVILLAIMFVISIIIEIFLAVKYVKFNKRKNSIGKTGEEIARQILDDNELEDINVKCSGSILFGNSYSHYFKKVRLRRLTWQKDSVSALAMASQKSCLAILDKENDPDMRTRIKLTPLIYFGPIACIPLILIGIVLDLLILHTNDLRFTVIFAGLGLLIYFISFIMSIKTLKTEVKAQKKAYSVLKESNMASDEEIGMLKELFKLYNIEYINNIIISLLELILRVLQLIGVAQSSSSKS